MNTLSSWEAQTVELISLIGEHIKESQIKLDSLIEERRSLEKALQTYRQWIGSTHAQEIKPKDFESKTLREILLLIAERNNKTVVVKDAVKLMKAAKVFGNPLHADSVVYSVLIRSPEFVKVGRGVYRMNGEQEREGKGIRKERIPGLKKAILELKAVNPDMTKQDVRDTLVKRRFDFKGKNPNKVVHILWVNLGYAKKDKKAQQSLFRHSG